MSTTLFARAAEATQTLASATATASEACITAVPGKYGYVPPEACNANWSFSPSFSAAIALSVLFGIVTLGHLVQAIVYKKGFCWVIIMGSLWETASFVTRVLGAHDQQNTGYATASLLLILLAPLWINAFVYMTAGRMIYCFIPEQKVWKIKATSIGKVFVWLDIASFLVQAAGGLMTTPGSSASTVKTGLNIYMAGIGVQQFFICLFFVLIVGFHREIRRLESIGMGKPDNQRWKWMVWVLYAALALITMRIIYRLVEFAGGLQPNNPLPFHEVYVYVLDAMPMLIAILLFNMIHPGIVLIGPNSSFPSRKERRQAKKAAKAAKKERKERKRAKNSLSTQASSSPMMNSRLDDSGDGAGSDQVELMPRAHPGHRAAESESEENAQGVQQWPRYYTQEPTRYSSANYHAV